MRGKGREHGWKWPCNSSVNHLKFFYATWRKTQSCCIENGWKINEVVINTTVLIMITPVFCLSSWTVIHKHGRVTSCVHARVLPKQHSLLHGWVGWCVSLVFHFFLINVKILKIESLRGTRLFTWACDQLCISLEIQNFLPVYVHGSVRGCVPNLD